MKDSTPIILASDSPRRRELLKTLQVPFEAKSPDFLEVSQPGSRPEEEVLNFARGKALSLRDRYPGCLIIGSDTLVVLDDRKLGKPNGRAEALEMLMELSGKTHRVLTGICVLNASTGEVKEAVGLSWVKMRKISPEEARAYVSGGEPMDKAGAYAVQGEGRKFVEEVEGDYLNVVGFPLREVIRLLSEFGVQVPATAGRRGPEDLPMGPKRKSFPDRI